MTVKEKGHHAPKSAKEQVTIEEEKTVPTKEVPKEVKLVHEVGEALTGRATALGG